MPIGNDNILTGKPAGPLPDCSLAEYLVSKMRSLPKDHIIQVDADTGAVQTVGELLEMGIRLSEGLKKLGLKEGDVVGLLSRNCFEASAVVLGTWLSGATVSPSAMNVKAAELKHVLGVSPPKFIFCEEEAVGTVTSCVDILSTPPTVILVDSRENSIRSHKTFQDVLAEMDIDSYTPQPVTSPATQLTSILYSSGSSGLPKGVGITHKNLIFQDVVLAELLDYREVKICLQISCFFWVTGVLMFLMSLTTGMTRVLLRETTIPKLLEAVERYKLIVSTTGSVCYPLANTSRPTVADTVTVVCKVAKSTVISFCENNDGETEWTLMSPSLLLSIVDSPEFRSFDLSSMKKIFLGGSPLTSAVIDRIKAKWTTVKIIQAYGTTESTGIITRNLDGEDLTSVGKVAMGVKVKVVDVDTGDALQSGSLGEICMKSAGIMKGYVGNEEATRAAVDSEGWLHTGDFGYYDDSGQVFIVDRMKEMLKINNYQVAPVEVENTILEVPGVAEAAVAGVTAEGNRTLIMAFVVKATDSTVTEKDINAHIAATLSDYKKLTAGIHFVDSLPKTNTGKLGRMEIKKMAQILYSGSSS